MTRFVVLVWAALVASCSVGGSGLEQGLSTLLPDVFPGDGGQCEGGTCDSSVPDAGGGSDGGGGGCEGGSCDGSVTDGGGGGCEGGSCDGSVTDGGGGGCEGGTCDGSVPDGGVPDAGTPDGSVTDGGTTDDASGGTIDAGLRPDSFGSNAEGQLGETTFYNCSTGTPAGAAVAALIVVLGIGFSRRRRVSRATSDA